METILIILGLSGITITSVLFGIRNFIFKKNIEFHKILQSFPLRTLSKSKFLQTYGRTARPNPQDRNKIDNKEIGINDLSLMNKPYAYIMIPSVYNGNEDDKANVIQLITELRDYGFNPNEDIVGIDAIHGIPEIEQPDGLNQLRRNLPTIGQTIEKLEAELEAEKHSKLTKIELLKDKFNL